MAEKLTEREREMYAVLNTVLDGLYEGWIKSQPLVSTANNGAFDIYTLDRPVMNALHLCGARFSDEVIAKFGWKAPEVEVGK